MPPKGSSLERRTISQTKRFAKPLAASVSVRCLSSSALVMCPIMETWAPVACMGLFFVSDWSLSPSQACRMSAESVLPSLHITLSTRASSGSTIKSRLSLIPGSKTTVSPFLFSTSTRSLTW
jgi:hypothetical protein